ncbi:hydrogenase small subunit [Desulfovibrio cuneatus]|uniref:hydrogenase small subunit n=1 Tax=Desulfovibrio cuneatus TaxID=159728 RepID=UPI000413D375|nr:hydrogenase small subunit [Desulfovibrio cuneatus]
MRFAVGLAKDNVEERLEAHGLSRRDFLKYCGVVAAAMGLGPSFAPEIARALTTGRRTTVVYLHNAECTGCTEALLRTSDPFLDVLLFDAISLEYQETIMAAAGHAAEEVLHKAIADPNGFVCIVEGAIPTAQKGIFGKVGNRTMLEINNEVLNHANCKAVISYGTCAAFGGVQAAKPNPTEAKGILQVFPKLAPKTINIPGCPPNPINLVGTIVYYLQNNGAIPKLDDKNRPELFYGQSVHELCERLPHFEAGEFAESFNSEEARKGWCLYNLGCKGPMTYNNCPKVKFNGTSWPVAAGHPCIGCSEPDFWDQMSPFYG